MSDIYFQCDCEKILAVDEAGVGRTVNCTDCNKLITIPKPAIRFACSKCGNNILAPEAIAGCRQGERFNLILGTGWFVNPKSAQ